MLIYQALKAISITRRAEIAGSSEKKARVVEKKENVVVGKKNVTSIGKLFDTVKRTDNK